MILSNNANIRLKKRVNEQLKQIKIFFKTKEKNRLN